MASRRTLHWWFGLSKGITFNQFSVQGVWQSNLGQQSRSNNSISSRKTSFEYGEIKISCKFSSFTHDTLPFLIRSLESRLVTHNSSLAYFRAFFYFIHIILRLLRFLQCFLNSCEFFKRTFVNLTRYICDVVYFTKSALQWSYSYR